MAGKLTALKIRSLTQPGRYGDGGGLWLQVRDANRRSWLFRYTAAGHARQMGLGALTDVSLAEAREAAQAARKLLRAGIDPIGHRNATKAAARDAAHRIAFREVATRYITTHEGSWRNAQHRYQWRATLNLANAEFGDRPVAAIDTGAVMRVLEPIWANTPETASRLRGRIEAVLDYAAARGWRNGENPARWRGHLKNLLPAPSRIARVEHHAALPWQQIGAFMAALKGQDEIAARALEFTILTAGRTGEVIGAHWPEFDLPTKLWTVPAERMKAGRAHRVPLSDAAVAILRAFEPLRDAEDAFVFPGARLGAGLSNMAMLMLLRRMGRSDLTVHGFRSTFRDWCAESTNYAREVCEQALAHTIPDAVERAYRRSDLFEKRRRLLAEWAEFCGREAVTGLVLVPLRHSG